MSQSFTDYVPLQRFQPVVAVAPDGTQVAYSSNRAGQYHLWLVPTAGGQPRAITDDFDLAVRAMVWHPDGDVLVYAANDRDPGVQDVLVCRGDEVRRLESEPGTMLFPAGVSPDGRWLSVTAARSNTDSDVAVVDLRAETLALTVLTPHEGEAQHMAGPWLGDSTGLYVRTDVGREFVALCRQPLDGEEAEPIEQPDWDVEHVATSEDGRVLAWSVNASGRSVLHVRVGSADARKIDLPSGEIDALALSDVGSFLVGHLVGEQGASG